VKRLRISFLPHKQGVSYAVSAVIVTATIVTLVLVASMYAYQVLEQQRGMAEFECAKESILAFNDALENVAWKPQAARSARFTIEYGHLELVKDFKPLIVNVTVGSNNTMVYYDSAGLVKYYIPIKYVNLGEGYHSYILGNESLLIVRNTESFGRAVVEQASSWLSISLNYRVRAMRTSVVEVDAETMNYVDIWVIKLVIGNWSSHLYDFDLNARCLNVTTTSYGPYDATDSCAIDVQLGAGSQPSSASLPLSSGKVVFNVVISKIQVTV